MLFMLKQQHYTLAKVRKVKSCFTTPLSKTPDMVLTGFVRCTQNDWKLFSWSACHLCREKSAM